jgi:hypothetical protein
MYNSEISTHRKVFTRLNKVRFFDRPFWGNVGPNHISRPDSIPDCISYNDIPKTLGSSSDQGNALLREQEHLSHLLQRQSSSKNHAKRTTVVARDARGVLALEEIDCLDPRKIAISVGYPCRRYSLESNQGRIYDSGRSFPKKVRARSKNRTLFNLVRTFR